MKNALYVFCVLLLFIGCTKKTESDLKLIPVKSGEYWGYIDHKGTFIINPQFKEANPFYEGLALVCASDGKFGFINEVGVYVINPQYKDALDFSDGLSLTVKESGKLEYINSKGEVEIQLPGNVESGFCFKDGMALNIENQEKMWFISTKGSMSIPARYRLSTFFNEDYAVVFQIDSAKGNVKYGYINTKGELAIPYQFDMAGIFREGLASIKIGEKYGFIDKTGKIVINPQFDFVSEFVNDLAIFKQGELYGYIDKTGKIVINPQFKSVNSFKSEITPVKSTDDKIGYIDKTGKYVINPQFEEGTIFYNDIAIVKIGEKYGLINKKGAIVVNPQFDSYRTENNEFKNIQSDFFDSKGIIGYIIENMTDRSFNGFSAKSTFNGAKAVYPNLTENNYYSFSEFKPKGNRFISLKNMSFGFNELYKSVDSYSKEQVYDPAEGGYVTRNVYTGSEAVINPNAKMTNMDYKYNLTGKALEKKELLVNKIIDQLKSKGFKEISKDESFMVLSNNNYSIRIGETSSEDLSLSIGYTKDYFNYFSAASVDSSVVAQ